MTDEGTVRTATWLLRFIGGSVCLALVPMFFPLTWMAAIHEWLGLGETPQAPIFEYLTRSLSAMYFAHGCFVLMISTDVVRYRPLVHLVGILNLFLGVALLTIDLVSPMPMIWTAIEGIPIAAIGAVVLKLASKLPEPENSGARK